MNPVLRGGSVGQPQWFEREHDRLAAQRVSADDRLFIVEMQIRGHRGRNLGASQVVGPTVRFPDLPVCTEEELRIEAAREAFLSAVEAVAPPVEEEASGDTGGAGEEAVPSTRGDPAE